MDFGKKKTTKMKINFSEWLMRGGIGKLLDIYGASDPVRRYVMHVLFGDGLPVGDLGKLARFHVWDLRLAHDSGDVRAGEELAALRATLEMSEGTGRAIASPFRPRAGGRRACGTGFGPIQTPAPHDEAKGDKIPGVDP